MIRLFVRHPVRDYAAWRARYDAFEPDRREMGVRNAAVFQAADDPNDLTIQHDFDSLEAGRAFVESARLKEAMAAAGVVGPPAHWFVRLP